MSGLQNLLLVFLLFGGVATGCRHPNAKEMRTDLLTNLPWKYKSYSVDGRDLSPPVDSIEFRRDGSSVLSDGTNTTAGSRWAFDGDYTLIFNRGTASQSSVEIIELTRDTFKFRGRTTNAEGKGAPFEAGCIH